MITNRRRIATTVAAALLTTGAMAAAATVVRRANARPRAAIRQSAELTPLHRGGAGSPLLLLHGITGSWHVWSPVLPYLEPHHDVIVPTLHGHGGGPLLDPQAPPSVQALVDGIEEVLDQLGLQTVHIAGNSLGGWVGIELARRGRARSLVLLSPAGAWRSQRSTRLRAIGIGLLLNSMRMWASRADTIATNPLIRQIALGKQVAYPDRVSPDVLATWFRANSVARGVVPLLRAIPRGQQVQPLPADPSCPVRLVWGDHDQMLPFDGFGSVMVERLHGAELVELAGAGHVPMSDDPTRVAELILAVAAGVDGALVGRDACT